MATKKIKGDLKVENNVTVDNSLKLTAGTGQRALELDASGNVISSSVTSTELATLSGVGSGLQAQIDSKVPNAEKGAVNGVATLDAGGKIPAAQLPNSVMEYKGNWVASTNTPALADGVGNAGDVYKATDAGSVNFGAGAISFLAGDFVVYSGSIWEKSINSNEVTTVHGRVGVVVAASGDYSASQVSYDNTTSGLAATDVKAALDEIDANVDAIVADTKQIKVSANDTTEGYLEDKIVSSDSSITITTLNDAGDEDLNISVNEASVDHDSLLNFVANEHIDHSGVSIGTAADSGLSGGGDITLSRSIAVDINGTTAETVVADGDLILIHDVSAGVLRKMTRSDFVGTPGSSAGDLSESSAALANNQLVAADITGLAFANATVRSFKAQVTMVVDATANLYEVFEIHGIQKAASWDISVESTGDDSLTVFSITSAGQLQYTSASYAGFVSLTCKFRAETLSI